MLTALPTTTIKVPSSLDSAMIERNHRSDTPRTATVSMPRFGAPPSIALFAPRSFRSSSVVEFDDEILSFEPEARCLVL